MGKTFKSEHMIRFEHCDPAGLIFYARYFQFGHHVIEDWFKDGLGYPHGVLVVQDRIGIPTVHIEADFLATSRLEEVIEYSLQVEKLGKSSVTLQINGHCNGEHRCRIKQVIVFADLRSTNEIKSVPIPAELRTRVEKYLIN